MSFQKIGPYEIQGVLGRGGMGTVFRGLNIETGSIDAIKVLAPHFADDSHFRGRFDSEIKALLKLNHKNIVKILTFGEENGRMFFSMELVNGNSLYDMKKKGHQFDWRGVLQIAKDCAQGLRHAHDRGVIHRDLKPGNLLMAFDDAGNPDHVKLTDFGIAKRFGNSQNTGTNILGTMDFMSPEQAKGEPVSNRSDLYSLGTVMFTLLSGRPPFTSNSVEESLRNLTRVPPPSITSIKPDVPLALEAIITRLMAKRPEDRIPTALALFHKLNEVEDSLREYSEAQTAHAVDSSSTFDVRSPNTVANTGAKDPIDDTGLFVPITQKQKAVTTPDVDPNATAVLTDDSIQLEPEPPRTQVDYYSTVTDQVRQRQVDLAVEEPETSKGALWLTIALLAVIALGTWGVVQALKPPTAESLYSTIEENLDQPQLVLKEIDTFLENYPDEPRAADVANMKRVGQAIRNYRAVNNSLTLRSRTPSGLSKIEKQFMEIAELAVEQPDAATAKMAAFANINRELENLTELETRCVEAAESYSIKRKHEVQSGILFNLKRVREEFERAQNEPDKEKSITILKSVIELYGDTNWKLLDTGSDGRELIEKSADEIRRLKLEIIREKEEQAAREAAEKAAQVETDAKESQED